MTPKNNLLYLALKAQFPDLPLIYMGALNEITLEVPKNDIKAVSLILRDQDPFHFDQLIDVCGVDYLDYGVTEWSTETATSEGFSRGVESGDARERFFTWDTPRFAVVYH